jgi:hypothetical protein
MLKKIVTSLVLLIGTANFISAQSSNDIMVSGGFDLIKTDYNEAFGKVQIGFEANYFVIRHFSVGAGVDIWGKDKNSFVMGMRWYANDNIFVRFRGLIGANDAAVGGGYSKAINKDWRVDGMGDFYVDAGEFGLRLGVSYIIH